MALHAAASRSANGQWPSGRHGPTGVEAKIAKAPKWRTRGDNSGLNTAQAAVCLAVRNGRSVATVLASRCVNGGRPSVERRTNGLRAVKAGRQGGGHDGDGAGVENRAGNGVSDRPRWQVGGDGLGVQVCQRRAAVNRAANQSVCGR